MTTPLVVGNNAVALPTFSPQPKRKVKTVFVALNDAKVAEQIITQIYCFGFRAHTFTTESALTEAILVEKPDVVIIDIDFLQGDLHGTQIIGRLNEKLTAEIPVIYISERTDLKARLACVRANGPSYMLMPAEISNILEKLEELTIQDIPAPFRVLIVEDSKAQAFFIASTLKNAGMLTKVVNDPFNLIETLIDFRPELILMDVYLPKCSGLELANVIRQQDAYVSVPIVFLSSEQDLSRQLKALTLGGDDFLTKPIAPEHLISAIESRAKRSRVLRSLMIRDSLTGLLNHTYLLEHLEIEVARAEREHKPLCFAMIDIDHFKQINDSHGHPVGDRVIKSLSHLLQQRLRKTDIIGRYGGEEFAVILPNTDLQMAHKLLDEIRDSFEELNQYAGKEIFHANFSAGIALCQQQTSKELCECADKALYSAKQNGRNRVVDFHD